MVVKQSQDEIRLGVYADYSVDDKLNVTLSRPESGTERPFTISREALKKMHLHCRGRTRSGKSSRLITPMIQQLMLPYGPNRDKKDCLLVIDLGGTPELFRMAKSEAKAQGRKYRFISVDPDDDWNTFDPFQSMAENTRTAIALAEYILVALSLDYGLVYGGSWYTQANLAALLAAAKEMEKSGDCSCLAAVIDSIAKGSKKDADQIRLMLNVLLEFVQLQTVEGREKIDFNRAIEDGEIIYFYMPSLVGATSAREIAGLGLYAAVIAAMERVRLGKDKRHTWIFVDEFHELAGRGFASLLAQSAKYGVSLILANQTTDQLLQRDLNLASMVSDNTSVKLYFTLTTKQDLEALQLLSKDRITQLRSESGRQESNFDSQTSRDVVSPTLEKNLALEVSATEGFAFCLVDDGKGHHEPTPIYCDYGLTEEVHNEAYTLPKHQGSEQPVVRPSVGVNKPFVSLWKRDYSENHEWQKRQGKLRAMWLAEGGK